MSNPYLGFRTYTEADKDNFAGRNAEIQEICNLIEKNQATVLYANSGTGKSSIINAGLIPKLRERYLPISLRFSEIHDANNFDETIIKWLCSSVLLSTLKSSDQFIVLGDNIEVASQYTDEARLRFVSIINKDNAILKLVDEEYSKKSLWWFLRTHRLVLQTTSGEECELKPLFIFDQFEELFDKATSFEDSGTFFHWFNNLCSEFVPKSIHARINELSCFLNNIGQHVDYPIIESKLPSKFLISMRRDYIGQLDYWTNQNEETKNTALIYNRYYLRALNKKQVLEVIDQCGNNPNLQHWKDQILACSKENNDGYSPMLLSVLCHDIYDNGNSYEQVFMYQDDFKSIGDFILSKIYDKALASSGIKKKQIAIIEEDLVDEHGKRRRIYTDDNNYKIANTKHIDKAIYALVEQGLIKCTLDKSNQSSKKLIELVHDKIAQVIMNRRRTVKKLQRIKYTRSYVAIIMVALFSLTAIGAWFPGIFNWMNPLVHGNYSASSNPHIFLNHSIDYSSLLSSRNQADLQQVETIEIDSDSADIALWNFPNLQEIIIPEKLDSSYIHVIGGSYNNTRLTVSCERVNIHGLFSGMEIYIENPVKHINIDNGGYYDNTIKVSKGNKRFVYSNHILWNTESKEIVYASTDADTLLIFPHAFEQYKKITWKNTTFYNLPHMLTKNFKPIITSDTLTIVR